MRYPTKPLPGLTICCRTCLVVKPKARFSLDSRVKIGRRHASCIDCRKVRSYEILNASTDKYLKFRFLATKRRAEKSEIPFQITFDGFLAQYNKQEGLCFYTGVKLRLERGIGKGRESLSIDKIIPKLGYIPGNVVFCTDLANRVKQDVDLEFMKEWLPRWYDKIKSL